MKRKIFTLLAACLVTTLSAFSQARKPTLMVVPSDRWCNEHGYMETFDNQGTTVYSPNYQMAFVKDKDINNVIGKINTLMAARQFPLKDMQQLVKNVERSNAENSLIQSKKSGASMAETDRDRLLRRAKCDLILELDWNVNQTGPRTSITYNLQAKDSYTGKAVAGAQGTGQPSISAELPVLLEEAVQDHMDNFTAQLQSYFDDLLTNGREVALSIRVFDNGSGLDLEKEYNGEELSEIITNWVDDNTVAHRFSKGESSEDMMDFEQVRIPLYKDVNGRQRAIDTEDFARDLRKFLKQAPYNLESKIINQGLGKCTLVLGEK